MKTDTQSLNKIRKIFKDRWDIDLHWYSDIYSRTDGFFTWNDKDYEVEVKCRRCKSDTYPTIIINKDKYDVLKNGGILICLYDDKWGVCKDVKKALLKYTAIYCNHCTDFPSNPEWGMKAELDINEFNWYEY